jgi:hypothetical protein
MQVSSAGIGSRGHRGHSARALRRRHWVRWNPQERRAAAADAVDAVDDIDAAAMQAWSWESVMGFVARFGHRVGRAYADGQAARLGSRGSARPDLGGIAAIAAAIERAGLPADEVDYVIMGQVLGAGAGQSPARQAAGEGRPAMSIPALTVNKVCLSGIDAIALADQLIRAGEFEVVVAGGMESMTNAPYLLTWASARGQYRLMADAGLDGLRCLDLLLRRMRDGVGHRAVQRPATPELGPSRTSSRPARMPGRPGPAAEGRFDAEITPVAVRSARGSRS